MKTIRSVKEQGISILFVSHKLEELFELCDRVTVMRDGEHILTKDISEMDNDSLISAMVGRTLDNQYPKIETTRGKEALRVEHLNSTGVLNDVSFHANYGEILGFSGLVGAGRTEAFRAIFGADGHDSGNIYINEKPATIKSPKDAIRQGLAFLTEDRKGQGLVLTQSVRTNLILSSMKKCKKGLFLDEKHIDQLTEDNVDGLKIKIADSKEAVGQLSGGNQQKVVIGKWINTNADIYIFDEPTRGIDVGAKVEVYNIMNSLIKAGKCVIMISSELPEIIGMSDRVIIMREGKVMGELSRDSDLLNQETIMKAAWGGAIQ